MQAAQNLFAGEQGVAYIPMPKGRGFTPRLVKVEAMDGGWKVEARTPDGMRLVVFDYGPRKRVIQSAKWAEAEPT